MILGVLWMCVANAAAILGSLALLRRAKTGLFAADALLFLLFHLLILSLAVLAAGVSGFLTPSGLGGAGALALGILLARKEHRGWSRPLLPEAGPLVWGALAVVALRLLVQVWFLSPSLGDPLAYHLPKVAEWVRAGGFTREMGAHPHAPFPAGFELIETWWVVFLKHDLLIELAGVEFLILGFLAVGAMAVAAGLSPFWGLVAGFLYSMTPGLHFSATSCLNDAPAAAMIVSMMSLAACRIHPSLLIAAAGLGLGIKPTVGFAIPGVLLLAWLARREPSAGAPARALAMTLSLAGLVVGAFWYARNAIWFGNPFHPLGSAGFADPTPVQFGPRLDSLWRNLINLVNVRITDHSAKYGPNVDHMAGWGGASFAVGVIGWIAGARDDNHLKRLGAAFGLSLAGILLLVQDDPWCLKYVFFFPAVLCLAAARLAQHLPGVRPFVWAAVAFSFMGTWFGYDLRLEDARTLASQSWRHRSAAALPYAGLDSDPGSDPIGYFGGPTGPSYLLYRPDFSRRVIYLRSTSSDALRDEMKSAGVQVFYCPGPAPEQQRVVDEAVGRGILVKKGGTFYRAVDPSK